MTCESTIYRASWTSYSDIASNLSKQNSSSENARTPRRAAAAMPRSTARSARCVGLRARALPVMDSGRHGCSARNRPSSTPLKRWRVIARVSRRYTVSKPRALSQAEIDARAARNGLLRADATAIPNRASLDATIEEKRSIASRASREDGSLGLI